MGKATGAGRGDSILTAEGAATPTWTTVGHDRAVNALKQSHARGQLAHAYLLTGPPQVGKLTLALDLARLVNCTGAEPPCGDCGQCRRIGRGVHPDVRIIAVEAGDPEEGTTRVVVGIGQVRQLGQDAALKPYEGRCRVFILESAERLSAPAANAFLKTLEEPPDQVLLVLLAPDSSALLPTIVSRCQALELTPAPRAEVHRLLVDRYGVPQDEAANIAGLASGRVGWAIRVATDPELLTRRGERLAAIASTVAGSIADRFAYAADLAATFGRDRDAVYQDLALWQGWWRDALRQREGASEPSANAAGGEAVHRAALHLSAAEIAGAIRAVDETLTCLERNVNARLAVEDMMLRLPRPRADGELARP